MEQQARAYKEREVLEARGKVAKFNLLLPEYRAAPHVTRERLYLDAMQIVLSGTSKVLVDTKNSNNMMYLPLDKLMQKSQSNTKPRSVNSSSTTSSSYGSAAQTNVPLDTRPTRGERQGRN